MKNEESIWKDFKKFIFKPLIKPLYVFLKYFFDFSANQSNYTVVDNHPVPVSCIKNLFGKFKAKLSRREKGTKREQIE